ncbi:hypothetical protein [Streptomyces abyssomicinicus]|uniref:hypothetical protein n=1 Tax=Streptomyces abyssomicinicus TaxID=574929 RepID=UPI00124F847E|nr:hypothetical protein [Streptomyces abyssomicinicus]
MSSARALSRTGRELLARHFAGQAGTVRLLAGLVLLGTVCSQHPSPAFSRVLRLDVLNVVFPNWRFFAPNPAQHDLQFYCRTLDEAGRTSEWFPVEVIQGRTPRQILWFPERRAEKAVFDLATEVLRHLDKGLSRAGTLPGYRMLRAYFEAGIARSGAAAVKGFQFTLVRNAGYDDAEEPEILFVSPYTPMRGRVAAAAEGGRA